MSTTKLANTLASRSPLGRTEREKVEPVNMYANPQVDKPANGENDMQTSGQADMATTPQNQEAANGQNRKPTKPQVEKYTTHLRPETIKAVKRAALDRDRKDYEIVQAALDAYLRRE